MNSSMMNAINLKGEGILVRQGWMDIRLIFMPFHDPIPTKADGGLDWTAVTAVVIVGVEDYHG